MRGEAYRPSDSARRLSFYSTQELLQNLTLLKIPLNNLQNFIDPEPEPKAYLLFLALLVVP